MPAIVVQRLNVDLSGSYIRSVASRAAFHAAQEGDERGSHSFPFTMADTERTMNTVENTIEDSVRVGRAYLISQQTSSGCWDGEVAWCPMVTAQYVLALTIVGKALSKTRRERILLYLRNSQRGDGSWGIHRDSAGYLSVTVLVFVALRILGLTDGDPGVSSAKAWIVKNGGASRIPTLGKIWLALFNLYAWEGVNPVLPELWLLPQSFPFHPSRFYCHTRHIYLGVAVVQALRYQRPVDALTCSLRAALFEQPYEEIDFSNYRNAVAESDIHVKPGWLVRCGYTLSRLLRRIIPRSVQARAISVCIDHIEAHLEETAYTCLSPVNGLLNLIVLFLEQGSALEIDNLVLAMDYWIWEDDRTGARFAAGRSQTWDTSFAVQALADDPDDRTTQSLHKALEYFEETQILEERGDNARWYNDTRRGGFCFSSKIHHWPVSDCTAEVIEAWAILRNRLESEISQDRLDAAAGFVLTRQNRDGGWGSYERNRGRFLLNAMNPSEMFDGCMIEESYIECTASSICGLAAYEEISLHPSSELIGRIVLAKDRGEKLLRKTQNGDGSWNGSWGIKYIYGTFFAIRGLVANDKDKTDPAVAKGVEWLKRIRLDDGGWGESWRSCLERRYLPNERSLVVSTSLASLALMLAGDFDRSILEPAMKILVSRQLSNGDWPVEQVNGVFFNPALNCYHLYKNYFPLWALAMYARTT